MPVVREHRAARCRGSKYSVRQVIRRLRRDPWRIQASRHVRQVRQDGNCFSTEDDGKARNLKTTAVLLQFSANSVSSVDPPFAVALRLSTGSCWRRLRSWRDAPVCARRRPTTAGRLTRRRPSLCAPAARASRGLVARCQATGLQSSGCRLSASGPPLPPARRLP